jgi:hypothetical protein
MKCFDDEILGRYAYRLTDEPVTSQVRAHLGECARCLGIVEQHEGLDAVLDEWKSADPTPGFDARVRQAVEAEQGRRERWGLWGLGWVRGLATASVAILIVTASVWLAHRHQHSANPSEVATRQPQAAASHQASSPSMKAQAASESVHVDPRRAGAAPGVAAADDISNDDQDGLAMEDYDVAANFELLSEMPKADSHGGN